MYAVTNRHVVEDGRARVLRINTHEGGFDTIETSLELWERPADDDLAVLPLELAEQFKWSAVSLNEFLTPEMARGMTGLPIGPGDEVAMIGRFVSHDGKQRNRPTVRFGNISMDADPHEKIRVGGHELEAFLVECRSLSGFSGSAVLVYPASERGRITIPFRGHIDPFLLGIDYAHIPTWKAVCQRQDSTTEYRNDEGDKNMWVDTNSGIAVVIPAWRIAAVLHQRDFVSQREHDDAELFKKLKEDRAIGEPPAGTQ